MQRSKLTLLVDGNWLLMSRLSVINNNVDDLEFCHDLEILMIKSINVVLRTFPMIDNVIFCADGGSWRSKIEIPKCLHHEEEGQLVEYKGTRQYSSDRNWELIFKEYEKFISLLQQNGITACREKDIEGDDWIYHWSTYLNKCGTNCIIWTKDNDLKQLVHTDSNKCFTVWWNKDNGAFIDDFSDDDFNFMFNYEYSENEQLFENICDKSISINKIDPKTIIINKIIKGDKSDNIFPIILRNSKTKKFRVSDKDIDYDLNYENDNDVYTYIADLLGSKKYAGKVDKTLDEVIDHFKYNRQLVTLNANVYPDNIKDILNEHSEYTLSKDLKPVEVQLNAEINKLQGILDFI